MTRTAKLNDLHYVLLAIAANRASGSLLPPSSSAKVERASITRAIRSLLSLGCAEEVETKDTRSIWREAGGQRFAVKITDAGRAAVHVVDGKAPNLAAAPADQAAPKPIPADQSTSQPAPDAAIATASAKPATKIAIVIDLMQRKGGATLEEMMTATGWLPHSTRAVLSGLRKKGYELAKTKRGDSTSYNIAKAA
jgi:hypothetical protein